MQVHDAIVHVATQGSNVRTCCHDQILAPPVLVVRVVYALTRTRLHGSRANAGTATLVCCVKRPTSVLSYFRNIPPVIVKNA